MVKYLRWDRAELSLYRNMTGLFLQTILSDLIVIESANSATAESIEAIYHSIINSLLSSSKLAVPANTKNYFKFWWDEKLDELKNKSIASCRIWKTAGKPRSGPIFNMYKKDRYAYRKVIRESRLNENRVYTNNLHEALLEKQGTAFWECWRSKFDSNKRKISHVDGVNDASVITEHFASHFEKVYTNG